MKIFNWTYLFILFSLCWSGCSNSGSPQNGAKGDQEDVLKGSMRVGVDETVLPLFLENKEVFESSYYNATIVPQPAAEVHAINSLIKGETSFAVLARELTPEESKSFEQRSIKPFIYPIAYDGIVLVTNNASADTSFAIADVIALLKGEQVKDVKLVFDNVNSSVLRYFKDLGAIDKIAGNYIEIQTSSEAVLNEVANSVEKIGFVSFNQYLFLKSSFKELDKIRILSVLNDKGGKRRYVKPSQASLSTDEYPLKREIFALNYQPNFGLGVGFSAFLTGDRGQRIVLKSGLLPVTMPGREIIIRDRIN
ncbi:PstS family phosphate ABC transporter substrate-binding protein [Sphingobacterium pedocola]|uniref:Phosphate ABC transporter n=1 Tax=Sphingobacterium pedocola TaxID=2082722 RepID=A0ABR9TC99_9SPHI|nr:substrate-binding domain-containing protein [Sphingobacterium pedocola]MBE8722905.1 phosphate ABC transporter [Sphingobacterium pedocola]